MLDRLKELNLDRLLNLEEAVNLSAYARSLEAEYEALGLDPPEWLERSVFNLREEIAKRTKAKDLSDLKALQSELESYKTVNEKRNDAQRRLADLQKRLGLTARLAAK